MKTIYSVTVTILSFFATTLMHSQSITAPELTVPYACASPSFNNYAVRASYTNPGFQSNNVFILELSDETGSFNTPFELKRVTNQNFRSAWVFNMNAVQFPQNVGSDLFKMRIRSTNPARTSAESAAFAYYWYEGTPVALNNYRPVVLCNGQQATIRVSGTNATAFRWYKNAVIIPGANTDSLVISSPGTYFAEVNLGPCNVHVPMSISNAVTVTVGAALNATIVGSNNVTTCPGTTHTFTAGSVPANYDLQWFRDGTAVTGMGNFLSYTTPVTGGDGNYYFTATPRVNGCTGNSQIVRLDYQPDFSVDLVTPYNVAILPAQSIDLTIATTASNGTITWYKNNVAIPGSNRTTITVVQHGIYKAKVTSSGTCSQSIYSPDIIVTIPSDYEVLITTSPGYVPCQNTGVILSISEVMAIDSPSRRRIQLQPPDLSQFAFQWLSNGVNIPGATAQTIALEISSGRANYAVAITLDGITYTSNTVNVNIAGIDNTITAGATTICEGNTEVLEAVIDPDYTYAWFRNNTPILGANTATYIAVLPGSYTCKISENGCDIISNELVLHQVLETDIAISPAAVMAIAPGGSVNFVATGALSYEWYNSLGMLLSSGNTLTANTLGRYSLIATIDGCTFTKEVQLNEAMSGTIPNVVTMNGDGINETWVLPTTYTSQSIEVTIYAEDGRQVFQGTNYQGNWPENNAVQRNNSIFYYIIKENERNLKKGSITILK